jgi:hypothetical protein
MKKMILKRNYKLFIAFIFVFSISSTIKAQKPLPCGNYKIDTAAENKAKQFQLFNTNNLTGVNYLVRVYFHICTNDDGTNAPITTEQLATEFNTLLASHPLKSLKYRSIHTLRIKRQDKICKECEICVENLAIFNYA